MIRQLAPTIGFVLLLTGTTMAAPFCDGAFESGQVEFGFSIGGKMSTEDRDNFDLMHLRQRGVDATRVERWNGCIRAFVRKAEGNGETMRFFEPGTYREVF